MEKQLLEEITIPDWFDLMVCRKEKGWWYPYQHKLKELEDK